MFLALGLLGRRSVTADPESLPPLYAHGYFAAATLGVIGLGFLVTRRYRVGLGLVAGMLAVGQLVTIAAVV